MRKPGKMRAAAVLALAMSLAMPAMAQDEAAAEGTGAEEAGGAAEATEPGKAGNADEAGTAGEGDKAEAAKPSRPFISESIILVPERLGPWTLQETQGFVGQPELGYALKYEHDEHPMLVTTLYVYPAGRIDTDSALDWQIGEVRRAIEHVVANGSFENLRFRKTRHFDQPLPVDDPIREQAKAVEEASVSMLNHGKRLRASVPETIPGRMLSVRLERGGERYESRGYVLYRSLYFYKGRLTAPGDAVKARQMDRLGEELMRLALSRITVDSTGSCGDSVINLDPNAGGEEVAERLMAGVLGVSLRHEIERCRDKLDVTVPEGYQALHLEYRPEHWK